MQGTLTRCWSVVATLQTQAVDWVTGIQSTRLVTRYRSPPPVTTDWDAETETNTPRLQRRALQYAQLSYEAVPIAIMRTACRAIIWFEGPALHRLHLHDVCPQSTGSSRCTSLVSWQYAYDGPLAPSVYSLRRVSVASDHQRRTGAGAHARRGAQKTTYNERCSDIAPTHNDAVAPHPPQTSLPYINQGFGSLRWRRTQVDKAVQSIAHRQSWVENA